MDKEIAKLVQRTHVAKPARLAELESRIGARPNGDFENDPEYHEFKTAQDAYLAQKRAAINAITGEASELPDNKKRALMRALVNEKDTERAAEATRTLELLADSGFREVDPDIRPVVQELVKRGYTTAGSCSGHSYKQGFISFSKSQLGQKGMAEVSHILQRAGFRNLHWSQALGVGGRLREMGYKSGVRPSDSVTVSFSLPGQNTRDEDSHMYKPLRVRYAAKPKHKGNGRKPRNATALASYS